MSLSSSSPDRQSVVVVCAYRPENVRRLWRHNMGQLRDANYYVYLDRAGTEGIYALARRIRSHGGFVEIGGTTRGLSHARNHLLRNRKLRWILFVDDDVILNGAAVEAVQKAFLDGAHIVGARLVPSSSLEKQLPWYVTPGQYHLLGWHNPQSPAKTWGAFMGVDAKFARDHAVEFDERLSRTGKMLLVGEDTSFVLQMKKAGALERVLDREVIHDIDPRRLLFRQLMQRCYWQGRAEVLRSTALAGFVKEWNRYRNPGARSVWASLLAPAYAVSVLLGMVWEGCTIAAARLCKSRRLRQ